MELAITFPKDPPHGMIFEAVPGLFFQFDGKNNAWVRIDGFESLGLATPITPGLMSSDDLKKLNGLIVPPPQASLKGEDCPITFSEGGVRLTSSDGSMSVKPALDVINKVGQVNVGGEEPWALHENTVGVDFRLDVVSLMEEMRKAGKFTQVQIQGKQGHRGERGDNGIDNLDTGPKGLSGADGKNSPFDGTITPEINAFELADQSSNRAIVDIRVETGPDGNFLVATRANIGNPSACPREVEPKEFKSPLALVLNQRDNAILHRLESPNECGNPCTVCVTSLHFLNLELLLDAVFDRFKERVNTIKQQKEALVGVWLRAMIAMFNEQKRALCCALENCRSARRNASTRQFIDSQRIQAAQGNFSLQLDSTGDRDITDMDPDKDCRVPGEKVRARRGVGCDCSLQFTLDARLHATDPRSLFLDRPVATIETIQSGQFGGNRVGILNIHDEISVQDDTSGLIVIELNSGITPPPQSNSVPDWAIHLENFSLANVEPIRNAGEVILNATLWQDDVPVGAFVKKIPISTVGENTIILNQDLDKLSDFAGSVNPSQPLKLFLEFKAAPVVEASEPVSVVSVDYTLGPIRLVGFGNLADITITLKDDWNNNNWTVTGINGTTSVHEGGASSVAAGLGFVELDLPAGDYTAEIIDCCANITNTRNIYHGIAAIEYNQRQVATDPDAGPIVRQTVTFPDLGTFNNNSDARVTYLGTKISFVHEGGPIRSWVVDPDLIASNNEGSITLCIRPSECDNVGVATDEGFIFIYRGKISPLHLIGIMQPFNGSVSAAANYGYGDVTPGADDVQFGPATIVQTSQSFFYNGTDGLSFYTIHGGTGLAQSTNLKMDFSIQNNQGQTGLRVADDPSEVSNPSSETFAGNWTVGTGGSDGIALGPFSGGAWAITVSAKDLGTHSVWQAVSADGNKFGITVDADGIEDGQADEPIIFTPIRSGCIMPYKQVVWLERGHRTGAACSAVVTLDGQKYIIVRRSLEDDMTCGGGESLANPCIAEFLALGLAHPAIAWPTINGEEFLGIPTSGVQGFTFDQALSDRVIAKLQAGDMENVNGDPANNISLVIFPTS